MIQIQMRVPDYSTRFIAMVVGFANLYSIDNLDTLESVRFVILTLLCAFIGFRKLHAIRNLNTLESLRNA